MKSSSQIDEAFKTIKTATQVSDVQDMVRKFLTREQTYSQLLKTVNESEAKIDVLKRSNEELRSKLHSLTLDSSSQGKPSDANAVVDQDSDIIILHNDLGQVMKEYHRLGDRFKGINIVNDQVSNWSKKIYAKFGVLTQDETFKEKPLDLI